ncbi:MAG TPA: hypothetical protein VEC06_09805 [Paucimonas sp.]|nr:hypothetical protein [Paucimonas sp.]
MPESAPSSATVDFLTKAVTLVSLALGIFATWKALPADAEIKRLQAETQRLDLALKQADAELKNLESNRKLTFELYQEVKKVIEKEDKDPREEDAVRVLVESLADEPFRWKLLKVIAVGAQSEEVKEIAAATSKFYEEEVSVQARPGAAPKPAEANAAHAGAGAYNVDFFFCEDKQPTSEPLARAARDLKSPSDTGRWRVRALPRTINQQPGYSITVNEIRYTPPEEKPVADALAKMLSAKGLQFKFHETSFPTPGYVSVFICQ